MVGGVPAGPTDFSNMTNASIPNPGADWGMPVSGGGSVRTRPISNRFGNGEPGFKSDVSAGSPYTYVEHVYSTPSIGYDHVAEMSAGMLAFSVRKDTKEAGTTFVLALHQLNQFMRQQWDAFVLATTQTPNNPNLDGEALEFLNWMQRFGERGLEQYAAARDVGSAAALDKFDPELQLFYERATEDEYCYLTQFGIRDRVSFLGPIMDITRSNTLDDISGQTTYQHTSQVVVGVGRRVPCSQMFGQVSELSDGAKLWLMCTRIHCEETRYGAFCIRPGGSARRDGPTQSECSYRDESGMLCHGHIRYVGTVNRMPHKDSSPYAIQQSTNTGAYSNNADAYNAHCTLPEFFINAGCVA